MVLPSFVSINPTICFSTAARPERVDSVSVDNIILSDTLVALQGVQILDVGDGGVIEMDASDCAQRRDPSTAWGCKLVPT
jgi:hypothetical protein